MRIRYIGIFLFLVLFLATSYLTDANMGIVQNLPFGAGLIAHFVMLLMASSGAILLWLIRKVFFDYKEADIQSLLLKARSGEQAAGLAIIGLGIHMVAFAIVILAILS